MRSGPLPERELHIGFRPNMVPGKASSLGYLSNPPRSVGTAVAGLAAEIDPFLPVAGFAAATSNIVADTLPKRPVAPFTPSLPGAGEREVRKAETVAGDKYYSTLTIIFPI